MQHLGLAARLLSIFAVMRTIAAAAAAAAALTMTDSNIGGSRIF